MAGLFDAFGQNSMTTQAPKRSLWDMLSAPENKPIIAQGLMALGQGLVEGSTAEGYTPGFMDALSKGVSKATPAMMRQRTFQQISNAQTPDEMFKAASTDPELFETAVKYKMMGSFGNKSGSTIQAAQALMQENPDLSFADAFSIAKSGLGVGNTYQDGMVRNLGGAPEAFGNIEAAKQGMGQQAEKNVDLIMNPQIVRAESDQRNQSQLNYAGPIREAQKTADARAEQLGTQLKQANTAGKSLDILTQAEALLPQASEGLMGATANAVKGLAGKSDETTRANEELKLLSGWLVANVPRMEGPQSNFDVENYKTMAADLGNTMKPIGDRMAALQGLRALQEKYAAQGASKPKEPSGMPQGARRAPDGNFYVPDPNRPGKYLKVN